MSNARELAELGGSYGTGGFVGMKNRIINGAMMIDQRDTHTVPVTPTDGQYTLDRWRSSLTQSGKYSVQQTSGSGFGNSLGVTSTSAYSVLTGDFFALQQMIEGFNFADMQWGTANASTVTLSFTVKSSLTGTFGGALSNSNNSRSYPFTYTISAANTWETKTVTIVGDTSGTWVGATNGVGCKLYFGLGVGTTYSGAAGSWSGSTYVSATGATSVVGTSGATFYITGVQLEKGSTATSFDYRPYGTELALCQRYYFAMSGQIAYGYAGGATDLYRHVCQTFPVPMRTYPTITNITWSAGTGAGYQFVNLTSADIYVNINSANTAVVFNSFTASAEL